MSTKKIRHAPFFQISPAQSFQKRDFDHPFIESYWSNVHALKNS
jgi:hypothetical protein